MSLLHKAYSGPFRKNYIAATFKQFEDNAALFVYGKPLLRASLPADAVALPSVMAPSIKKSHNLPNLYNFKIRFSCLFMLAFLLFVWIKVECLLIRLNNIFLFNKAY